MKGLNIPASVMGVAFVAVLLAWCWGPVEPVTPATDHRAVLLAESLATARAEAAYNLQAWETALRDRDTVVRRVVRYIARHDTAWRTVQDSLQVDTVELVRWLAVSDSTLRVVRDSLEGELVQCRYDVQVTADALAAKPSGYWWGFGHGAMVGGSAALAVCGLVR